VRQVGYLAELYADARSEKFKTKGGGNGVIVWGHDKGDRAAIYNKCQREEHTQLVAGLGLRPVFLFLR